MERKYRDNNPQTKNKDLNQLKLPKFEIKKFSGNPTEWKAFSDSFHEAIHKNTCLSDIQKMNTF